MLYLRGGRPNADTPQHVDRPRGTGILRAETGAGQCRFVSAETENLQCYRSLAAKGKFFRS